MVIVGGDFWQAASLTRPAALSADPTANANRQAPTPSADAGLVTHSRFMITPEYCGSLLMGFQ
jgi:hypothetical protein